jgi:hypothetical protein
MDNLLEQKINRLQETIANLWAGMHELDEEGKQQNQDLAERVFEEYRSKLTPGEMLQVEEYWKSLEPHSQLIGNRDKNSLEDVPDVSMRLHERYRILKMLLKKK